MLRVLVLDEADTLLGMGFKKEVHAIVAALPSSRQTLLFSATFPEDVQRLAREATRRDGSTALVDVVGAGSQTNAHVQQSVTLCTQQAQGGELLSLLRQLGSARLGAERSGGGSGGGSGRRPHKAIVFFPTGRMVQLYAALIRIAASEEDELTVLEMHSRLSQVDADGALMAL